MRKYRLILIDTLILCLVSTLLAVVVTSAADRLKGKVKGDDPIVAAIIQANTKELEKLVQRGASVTNQTDELGRTALMRAAFANYSDTRGSLGGEAPTLLSETDAKRAGTVGLLLHHGAEPDTRDHDGWSALMWASWSGLDQVAAMLLDSGASLRFADPQGNTALIIAAQRGNAVIVKALLAKGADRALANRAGQTALQAARSGMGQYPERKPGYEAVIGQLEAASPATTGGIAH